MAFAFLFLFLFVESRPDIAKHPIMPLSLFKIWNFSVSSWVVFFTGATMAAGYVYLPLFFQYALLQSASESGISMIPMMLGLPVGAIFTGIFVTKSGKYVMYPIIGCAAAIVANYLYMTMRPDTPSHQLVGFLILGGLAAGPNVQVPLLAAQNAVPMADVAAATSSIQFFQSVSGVGGGSGVRILGVGLLHCVYRDLRVVYHVRVAAVLAHKRPPLTPFVYSLFNEHDSTPPHRYPASSPSPSARPS